MRLYAIYDKKAANFGEPLLAVNDAVMVRYLKDGLSPQHPMLKYPEDFDLYSIAGYSQDTGRIEAEAPQFICNMAVVMEVGHA